MCIAIAQKYVLSNTEHIPQKKCTKVTIENHGPTYKLLWQLSIVVIWIAFVSQYIYKDSNLLNSFSYLVIN